MSPMASQQSREEDRREERYARGSVPTTDEEEDQADYEARRLVSRSIADDRDNRLTLRSVWKVNSDRRSG